VLDILVDTAVKRCQVSKRNEPKKESNNHTVVVLSSSMSMLIAWSDGSSMPSIVDIGIADVKWI
jgi:hypothetical protein